MASSTKHCWQRWFTFQFFKAATSETDQNTVSYDSTPRQLVDQTKCKGNIFSIIFLHFEVWEKAPLPREFQWGMSCTLNSTYALCFAHIGRHYGTTRCPFSYLTQCINAFSPSHCFAFGLSCFDTNTGFIVVHCVCSSQEK